MDKYFIYCRKSTESEDRQVLSIESQVNEMKALALRLGISISEIFTESRTAKEPGRPIFNTMMKRVYAGEARGILSWKLDRLARNPIDGAAVIWALRQNTVKIVTPQQTYSHGDDNTILMYIEFGMAQKYVDDLSRNVKRGKQNQAGKGRMGWHRPPRLSQPHDPMTKERTLVVDEERFPILRKMWTKMLSGSYSVEQVVDIANNKWGLKTRKTRRQGGNPVSLSGAYRLFTNPFYCGIMQRTEGSFLHKYQKLINADEFDRVQELLGRKNRPHPHKHAFAYTGMMHCNECNCSITAEELTKRIRKDGTTRHYTYYRCTKKKKDLQCSEGYLSLPDLETYIADFLDRIHIPKRFLPWLREAMLVFQEQDAGTSQVAVKNLEQAYTDATKSLEVLMGMRMRDLIKDSEFVKERDKLQDEQARIHIEIQKSKDRKDSLEEAISNIILFAHRAKIQFKNGDLATKRQILGYLGSNWRIGGKKLYGELHKPFLLIEETLNGLWTEDTRLEPDSHASVESPYVDSKTVIPILCGLLDSVRKEILESKRSYTATAPEFLEKERWEDIALKDVEEK